MTKLNTAPAAVHTVPTGERAELRVELLPNGRLRLGLFRGSPTTANPADFVLVSGFGVDLEQAKSLRDGLALGIRQLEAGA